MPRPEINADLADVTPDGTRVYEYACTECGVLVMVVTLNPDEVLAQTVTPDACECVLHAGAHA